MMPINFAVEKNKMGKTADQRKLMIKALKLIFVPKLKELGFTGSFPHFRRIKDNQIDLLAIQFDKYGGEFWITISKCPTENIRTLLGNPIEPNKATAWNFGNQHVPGNKGFPYNRFNDPTKFEALAQQSLSYIDEAERWWRGELVKKKGIFGYLKNKFNKNT